MKIPFCSFTCIFCLSLDFSSCAHSPESRQEEAPVMASAPEMDANGHFAANTTNEPPALVADPKPTDVRKVQVTDQSLNMVMGTVNVPSGWKLHQDVASNPQGSGYLRFHLAIESPQGEIHGYLPLQMKYMAYSGMYMQPQGADFEYTFNYLMHYSSAPYLEKIVAGPIQLDREAMAAPEIKQFEQQNHQMVMQSGHYSGAQTRPDFGVYKIEFSASRKQVAYKGTISGIKLGSIDMSPDLNIKSGMIVGAFILAPEAIFNTAIHRGDMLQLQVSPQWDQRRAQIIDRETQQMTADHNQRMRQQQQQFQSHQQHMASMRQGFEQQNKDWYDRNFSSYNSNAAVNDAITGHTTFNDPYTGHQIKQEGHYNYWYTNEYGEYHGTDDPSFQPGSQYSGNWQPVQPVKPRH